MAIAKFQPGNDVSRFGKTERSIYSLDATRDL